MTVYIRIDWGESSHEMCIMNEKGEVIVQQALKHTVSGFESLERVRQQPGLTASECIIGIESAHTLLIDWLWAQHYEQIYVVAPHTVEKVLPHFL